MRCKFLGVFSCLLVTVVAGAAKGQVFIGDEVGIAKLNTMSNGTRPDNTAALRQALEDQMVDTGWAAAALGTNPLATIQTATTTGVSGSGLIGGHSLGGTISHVEDVAPGEDLTQISWQFGSEMITATVTRGRALPGTGGITSTVTNGLSIAGVGGNDLQDGSVRPELLNGVGGYVNTGATSTSGHVNALVFDFDKPVKAFGAWFGDLETRTDEFGENAYLSVDGTESVIDHTDTESSTFGFGGTALGLNAIDSDGWLHDDSIESNFGSVTQFRGAPNDPVLADVLDERNGGSASDGGGFGAGNGTSRWIGFVSETGVSQFVVAVGDDDAFVDDYGVGVLASNANGQTEQLSFIGATVVGVPEPSSLALLSMIGLGVVVRRRRK